MRLQISLRYCFQRIITLTSKMYRRQPNSKLTGSRYDAMKKYDLSEQCRSQGLESSGTKNDLIGRLLSYDRAEQGQKYIHNLISTLDPQSQLQLKKQRSRERQEQYQSDARRENARLDHRRQTVNTRADNDVARERALQQDLEQRIGGLNLNDNRQGRGAQPSVPQRGNTVSNTDDNTSPVNRPTASSSSRPAQNRSGFFKRNLFSRFTKSEKTNQNQDQN